MQLSSMFSVFDHCQQHFSNSQVNLSGGKMQTGLIFSLQRIIQVQEGYIQKKNVDLEETESQFTSRGFHSNFNEFLSEKILAMNKRARCAMISTKSQLIKINLICLDYRSWLSLHH